MTFGAHHVRISKAAWHNVHHDVAWFWYLFACLLENLAVESSAAWVPHIVAAPVLWTHQVENQGDHANWSLRLSTQHGLQASTIYQQLHILHHLYVHYLYNRSIHRQNIMKCEYMMIYECTVCVERLTTWHSTPSKPEISPSWTETTQRASCWIQRCNRRACGHGRHAAPNDLCTQWPLPMVYKYYL